MTQVIIDKDGEEQSLAVMTTRGPSGVVRVVLGSVADRVAPRSNAPVLSIR